MGYYICRYDGSIATLDGSILRTAETDAAGALVFWPLDDHPHDMGGGLAGDITLTATDFSYITGRVYNGAYGNTVFKSGGLEPSTYIGTSNGYAIGILRNLTDFGISFWAKPGADIFECQSIDTSPGSFFSNMDLQAPGSPPSYLIYERIQSGTSPNFSWERYVVSPSASWNHIVFNFTGGSDGVGELYFNGQLIPLDSSLNAPLGLKGGDFDYILFNGSVDQIRLYTSPVSASRVAELWNNGKGI